MFNLLKFKTVNVHLVAFFISTLAVSLAHGLQTCESYLDQNTDAVIFGDFSVMTPKPYLIGSDTQSLEDQKAELIRLALKEQFPHLQIYVEPKALPKKLDLFAVLDFFYLNQAIIKRIFEGYSSGDIIFTNHTSIASYVDLQRSHLQLRFQVSNQFGSALLKPFAPKLPLDRYELVNQLRMFLSLTTPVSPNLIR